MTKLIKTIALFLLVINMNSLYATRAYVIANIKQTLLSMPDIYGSCMVRVDIPETLTSYGVDCPGQWISLSCTGDFHPKDIAYKMFDTAQMSLAIGANVQIEVNDLKKHNGYCVAERMDIYRVE